MTVQKGEAMERSYIFHVDVNSAFLSWTAVKMLQEDPSAVDLRTIPSAVGGRYSYPARNHYRTVDSGQEIWCEDSGTGSKSLTEMSAAGHGEVGFSDL